MMKVQSRIPICVAIPTCVDSSCLLKLQPGILQPTQMDGSLNNH